MIVEKVFLEVMDFGNNKLWLHSEMNKTQFIFLEIFISRCKQQLQRAKIFCKLLI